MGINMHNDICSDVYEEIEKILIKFNLPENERKELAYKLTYNCKSFMGTTVCEWTPKCADFTVCDAFDMFNFLRKANTLHQIVFMENTLEGMKIKLENHFKNTSPKTVMLFFEVKEYIPEERIYELTESIQDMYCDKKSDVDIIFTIDWNDDIKKNISLTAIALF